MNDRGVANHALTLEGKPLIATNIRPAYPEMSGEGNDKEDHGCREPLRQLAWVRKQPSLKQRSVSLKGKRASSSLKFGLPA